MNIKKIKKFLHRWHFTLFDSNRIAVKRINNYSKRNVNIELLYDPKRNIGDTLNPVVFSYLSNIFNLSPLGKHRNTNLSMIGSIIGYCPFNCYIWGSGLLSNDHAAKLLKTDYIMRKIFAVRGPLTRNALITAGYKVPMVFGDPAILLPLIYNNPDVQKKYDVSFVPHYVDETKPLEGMHIINVLTDDYKSFVNEITASKLVISSSLHGIIIAESYGVPTIWLKNSNLDDFKFLDWYLSTREIKDIVCSDTLLGATKLEPKILPAEIIHQMQTNLLNAFPKHLFRKNKKNMHK